MTLDGMAEALEVSRRLIAGYRKNKRIPAILASLPVILSSIRQPMSSLAAR